jgi:hypothetical protein
VRVRGHYGKSKKKNGVNMNYIIVVANEDDTYSIFDENNEEDVFDTLIDHRIHDEYWVLATNLDSQRIRANYSSDAPLHDRQPPVTFTPEAVMIAPAPDVFEDMPDDIRVLFAHCEDQTTAFKENRR